MNPSDLIFILTLFVGAFLHLKNLAPVFRSSQRLEKAVRAIGSDPIVGGMGWQFIMFRDPNAILNKSDTETMRALKNDFIAKWKSSIKSHRITACVVCVGFALGLIVKLVFK